MQNTRTKGDLVYDSTVCVNGHPGWILKNMQLKTVFCTRWLGRHRLLVFPPAHECTIIDTTQYEKQENPDIWINSRSSRGINVLLTSLRTSCDVRFKFWITIIIWISFSIILLLDCLQMTCCRSGRHHFLCNIFFISFFLFVIFFVGGKGYFSLFITL